ncbi:MAG: phage baseplate assembly protein V [Candidatus Falkowbacteria bacterium]
MYLGKFRAIAVDTNDPENRGRIRVKCPHIYGDYDSPWCEPCVPYADANEGIFFIPSAGQGVWIECESGNYDFPIWVGMWWAVNELKDAPFTDKTTQVIKGKNKLIVKVGTGQVTIENGSITIDGNTNIAVNGSGGITLNGACTINGHLQVNSSIDASGDVKAGSISLKNHTHDVLLVKSGFDMKTSGKPK